MISADFAIPLIQQNIVDAVHIVSESQPIVCVQYHAIKNLIWAVVQMKPSVCDEDNVIMKQRDYPAVMSLTAVKCYWNDCPETW